MAELEVEQAKQRFQIGGITIELITVSKCRIFISPTFKSFLLNVDNRDKPADLNLFVRCDQFPIDIDGDIVFDSQVAWKLFKQPEGWALTIKSHAVNPFRVGFFNNNFSCGTIYIRPSTWDSQELDFPLGRPMGEILYLSFLSQGYGVLLHSCGIKYNNQGIIIAGQGGAGKSTTSRLWLESGNVKILSDDRVVVRELADGFRIFGTPWPGSGGTYANVNAPLVGLYFLNQAMENRLRPVKPPEAVARLLTAAFMPLWNNEGMAFTLEFFEKIAHNIPCYELSFTPDRRAVDIVKNNIR